MRCDYGENILSIVADELFAEIAARKLPINDSEELEIFETVEVDQTTGKLVTKDS